jgi:tetratricopeptide (TPR) repeat protein
MGRVMAAFRRHPHHGRTVSQEVAGPWVHTTQSQISRLESGPPIRDLDKLILWATALQIPADLLWFDLPDDGGAAGGMRRATAVPARFPCDGLAAETGHTLASALLAMLDSYAAIDNLTGPSSLLPAMPMQLAFIESRLVGTSGSERRRLSYVAARLAEFLGWLHHDGGGLRAAMQWSNRALDLAAPTGDPGLLSYIWMRKSNIASDLRRRDLALSFASAALESAPLLAPRLRAVARRQEAHAYALAGDLPSCATAIDDAHADASRDDDEHGIAGYCTASFVEMEAAQCWTELGRPERAVPVLERSLRSWDPAFRRDSGLCLARLASAQAQTEQPDESVSTARRAIAIVEETRSERTIRVLASLPGLLDNIGARDASEEARHMLTPLRRRHGSA